MVHEGWEIRKCDVCRSNAWVGTGETSEERGGEIEDQDQDSRESRNDDKRFTSKEQPVRKPSLWTTEVLDM